MSATMTRRGMLVGSTSLLLGAFVIPGCQGAASEQLALQQVVRHVPALGTRVSFLVRHGDVGLAQEAIRKATKAVFAVHECMTLHEPSPLTHLNAQGAWRAVVVPPSLLAVLLASQRLHGVTNGLFDATLGTAIQEFTAMTFQQGHVPSNKAASALVEGAGWDKVMVDKAGQSVRFSHPRTALDFNGIAKGYAVDQAVGILKSAGLQNFLVNAGGDLYAAGRPSPQAKGWNIRVQGQQPGEQPPARLMLSDQAVATSGNRFQKQLANGQLAQHLLHPERVLPTNRILSSTVVAKTAMEADALATALFVGERGAMARTLEQVPGAKGYLVDSHAGFVALSKEIQ